MNRLELRRWRKTRHLTQAQLGQLLGGVTINTVSRWELGEFDLPPFLYLALERLDELHDFARETAA